MTDDRRQRAKSMELGAWGKEQIQSYRTTGIRGKRADDSIPEVRDRTTDDRRQTAAKSTTTKSKISETHQTTDNREQQNQTTDDG